MAVVVGAFSNVKWPRLSTNGSLIWFTQFGTPVFMETLPQAILKTMSCYIQPMSVCIRWFCDSRTNQPVGCTRSDGQFEQRSPAEGVVRTIWDRYLARPAVGKNTIRCNGCPDCLSISESLSCWVRKKKEVGEFGRSVLSVLCRINILAS